MADGSLRRQEELIREFCGRFERWDAAALGELARVLLPVLKRRLHRVYRRASADMVSDACVDAILDFGAHPERFDSTRGLPLDRFLQMAATRNLGNLLEADARRRHREAAYATQDGALGSRSMSFDDDVRRRILSVVNEGTELKAFAEWLSGERRTASLAATLGLSHLSPREQRYEIKRFKDRVRRRVLRLLGPLRRV